ncbi:MAG: ABC transporter ATP-binding protein [Candidatus Marinimicrobia bacterium]|jgi:ABC-2 type transport system ATP-binding protein|nr:ABC transporter ATP-binding protein [Candidatus Neomarinimicrobiota bacterium]
MKNNLAIKIINLFKSYENVKAVNGIDLEIKKGEFYGLLGPNGAGKSTTINSITSLVKPSNGSIEIFGKNIEEDFRFARSKVGIAHQEVSQDWFFPIEQLLYFQAGFYGILRKDSKERIEYLLNKLGLFKHKSKKMRELSGGMKRRLQIAKALVHDPDIIILDEPTAGVDVELRHDLWSYLQELHSEGKTILLTTHYIDEAELLCEKVGIIDKGKLIVEDSVDNLKKMVKNSSIEIQLKDILERKPQFLNDYEHNIDDKKIHIITDKPNMELPSIILKFSEKAIKIEDIHIPQTSLEDVFLDLTGRKIND